MKMVLIAYSEGIDEEVSELLLASSVQSYTKWTKVLGVGTASEPHLASHIWPKANNVLAVCVEDTQADALMDGVRKLRETLGEQGVKAFSLPVEAVT